MDPSVLNVLNGPDCNDDDVHRNHTAKDRVACTFKKNLRILIEIMLVICFVVEFIKYIQAEEHLIDKLKVFVQIFNVSKHAVTAALGEETAQRAGSG